MTQIKTRDIRSALAKKGFEEVDTDHHIYIYIFEGKKTGIKTKVSHSSKEIGDPLISEMKKQLKLSKSQFIELVNCPLTKEDLQNIYSSFIKV
jgi:predicted RNA binding protein YcfA (HicA-like mRNA interferase family)